VKTIDVLSKSLDKAKQKGYKSSFDFTYEKGRIIDGKTYYAIIFDKDFCKAIWSDEKTFLSFSGLHQHLGENVVLWKWHLRNMVVSDNPIKYLEDNLELDSWEKIENEIY
jgi:hypothetical protein